MTLDRSSPSGCRTAAQVSAQPGRAEREALVELDGRLVGAAHFERVLRAGVADALEQPLDQRSGDPSAAKVGVDGDVHDVPYAVVARADQVADEPPVPHGG